MNRSDVSPYARLYLQFDKRTEDETILKRFEYYPPKSHEPVSATHDSATGPNLPWRVLSKALCLCFIDYKIWAAQETQGHFEFCGGVRSSPAATLCDAIATTGKSHDHWVHKLFGNDLKKIFIAKNPAGRAKTLNERGVQLKSTFLPASNVILIGDQARFDRAPDLLKLRELIPQHQWSNKMPPPPGLCTLMSVTPYSSFSAQIKEFLRRNPLAQTQKSIPSTSMYSNAPISMLDYFREI